ncbi:MAG: type II toxin-antitoxin system VapC family toxin [Legionellaceae bacterium]|nr:type II toxin-antitoxin system VapC family toxin [Legionellaceae bacterium]MBP9775384.1 type II toxin-antitoxin system VapC family toxin [Legionellaceae bacterium]
MRILLDTHTFLWTAVGSPQLSVNATNLFLETQNELYLSVASVWEIAIKCSLSKLVCHKPIEAYILDVLQENTIQLLNIDFRHVMRVSSLPFHHRDPFDRLLISQAIEEKIPLLSCDAALDAYGIERLW